MPQSRTYSVEEVLNFTVKDIQGPNFVDVKIKGWLKLTSEQRERCILKLRDLVRQRDELAHSTAVNANDLEDRLNRVERSRSSTPILPPLDPNDPETIEEHLRIEREAHEALISNKGRPCYPIELGFNVFNDPGQYKDIFWYWQQESDEFLSRLIFAKQSTRWKYFRQSQQRNRRYFKSHKRFPEFQQEVLERRRRHGLDGDVHLLEKQDKQSQLDDWMEYQDYELREYERLEKDLKDTHARLVSRRETLAKAGISAFEGTQELEFGNYYGLAIECNREEAKANKKKESAERKLRLAEKRLKTAESNDLGERVEKATWVGLFLKEVESAQLRLNELQRLAENARRDLEPFNRWWETRPVEWDERREEDSEGVQRTITPEIESAEYQDKFKKLKEFGKKNHEAEMARFVAKEELEFTEEGYKAARLDDFGEAIEKAALIKVMQEEVRSAMIQFEEETESTEKMELRGKVLGALGWIPIVKGKIKRHNVLLKWIEQQRREIAASCAPTGCAPIEKKDGQDRSKRASSRALRNRPATEASRTNTPSKANGRKRKQSTTRSILSPVDPGKVSKMPSKRRSPRQKMNVPRGTSQAVEKTATDSRTHQPRSKQVVKDVLPASLRPIHSLRVSKPGRKRPTGGSPRRSPRTSKPPERFRSGSMRG